MDSGNVVNQGTPIITGLNDILKFDETALIKALRRDQNGETTFLEFIDATWKAGVVSYEVNFEERACRYFGVLGECYVEEYVSVEV